MFQEIHVSQLTSSNHRWNKEAVIDSAVTTDEEMKEDNLTTGKHLCEVCYIEYDFADTFSMDCGHRFCRQCYTMYVQNAISQGPEAIVAKCPRYKCSNIISRSIFMQLLDT